MINATIKKLSENAQALLVALRNNVEGGDILPSDDDVVWNDVYLDNAFAQVPQIHKGQRAGYLSALTKAGVYREVDGFAFGMVSSEDREG